MLGSGYYGEAWQHEDYPEWVVKVSGYAGWAYEHPLDQEPDRLDAWPVFARHCAAEPHKNLPKIVHLEQMTERMTWAIMPLYYSASDLPYRHFILHPSAVDALRAYFRAEFEKEQAASNPAQGTYYVSVDGAGAPRVAHATEADAVAEADRIANTKPGNVVRVLQQRSARMAVVDVRINVL